MVHTHGWVRRKVKNSDKWVRRWLEVNKHVLYSYQSCPADMPSARVMNMLDLRKTREIKLVTDANHDGLFLIIPESADNEHPGYMMKAETAELAAEWVAGLNTARQQELEKIVHHDKARSSESICCCFWRPKSEERASLVRG